MVFCVVVGIKSKNMLKRIEISLKCYKSDQMKTSKCGRLNLARNLI